MKKTVLTVLTLFFMVSVFFTCADETTPEEKSENQKTDYTVSFQTNGETAISDQSVAEGDTITRPDDPVKSGYNLEGWYSNSSLTAEWNFSTVVTEDMTLYAKWTAVSVISYTVSFQTNGGTAVSDQTVAEGDTITRPGDPVKSGYNLEGWYSNSSLTAEWNFSTVVTEDMTLYAKWTDLSIEYKIRLTFNGPSVSPASVYACWIENEDGTLLQNIYICKRVATKVEPESGVSPLLGDAIPYWLIQKYPDSDVDVITGASVQGSVGLSVTRDLALALSGEQFRVVFEIDRSANGNDYFIDRPSFIYRSELIDTGSLLVEYPLSLYGWMANDTTSAGQYSQALHEGVTIPGFAPYVLMTDLGYISDVDDMVTELKVVVEEK
ncbi:MAG: InlB B-repeat-containing protein [Spirochaetes bacterium]|nr:InlB B-repeat-containing protein [Spirochaetota bacterium]